MAKKEKKKSNIEQDDSTIYALQIGISRRTPITFIIADGFYFLLLLKIGPLSSLVLCGVCLCMVSVDAKLITFMILINKTNYKR